ncbi:hypothetical protein DE146DRAFT_433622 [Phaeosphaeria sp. MPI-PUGE-AT-0046c]|nr:hypothetical protein DE146DRAFT_433622 [Phaeosphaeria sp. MPI-PUGE-AT-0046c]
MYIRNIASPMRNSYRLNAASSLSYCPTGTGSLRFASQSSSAPPRLRRLMSNSPSSPYEDYGTRMRQLHELSDDEVLRLASTWVCSWRCVESLDTSSMVYVRDLLKFAIEADVRKMFEERNFSVQQVLMNHNALNGYNERHCFVLLACPHQVQASIGELNGQ